MNHTSVVYNTVVQNPFRICQEGLCAAIHFLFNILHYKQKAKINMGILGYENCISSNFYLLQCAKIHGMKNVLCVIRMLFKRDGFLEGFSLDDRDNGKESEHRENQLHSFPLNQT